MTTYNYTTERYGPYPWQTMLVGRSTEVATDKYAYVYCPGGGWGLRDAVPFLSKDEGGTPYSVRTQLYGGAFDNTDNAEDGNATVFVLNVASESHNAGAISVHQGRFSSTYYPGQTPDPAPTVWDSDGATAYAVNDRVVTATGTAVCIQAHNSSSDKNPSLDSNGDPVGANAATYWNISFTETNLLGRFPNRGEMTPGSLAQSAMDVQRAISHIRRNAASYDIDTDKVLLEGSSAGAQAAGLAAYGPPLNFGHDVHPTVSHQFGTEADCRPNGLVMTIAACQQNNYASVDKGTAAQSLFLSFMNSLFGQYNLTTQSNWADIPQNQKKALDPYWAAYTSGYYCPTYFIYDTDAGYDDPWSYDQIANGVAQSDYTAWSVTGSGGDNSYEVGDLVSNGGQYWYCSQQHDPSVVAAPTGTADLLPEWKNTGQYLASNGVFGIQIHHSQNGRLFMEQFTKSPSAGGMGIPQGPTGDIRMLVLAKATATTERHVYHTYSADRGTAGVEYDVLSVSGDGDNKKLTVANDMLDFFTQPGLLTKYI